MSEQPPASPAPPVIDVVVLAYNSEQFMAGCLDALARSRGVSLKVITVDNQSRDASHAVAEAHPATTRAIRTDSNRGCAGGNNVGWRAGDSPIVVFINPDCRVEPDSLAQLVAPMVRDDTVGVCGARLLYPNTRIIQHAGGIMHPNAMCEHIGAGKADAPEYQQTREVDYVTGALIAFRRRDLEILGGFDEEYHPAYYEETDLIWRVRARGGRVLYVGEAVGYHWESPGLTKDSARFVATSYRSRILFILKNYRIARLFTRFFPFEFRWFFGPFARGFRRAVVRSYLSGALFALRCAARFSRRPPGVQS